MPGLMSGIGCAAGIWAGTIDVKPGSLVAETLAPVKGRRQPEYPASNRLCTPPH
ncbi:MAG: hypothetical protein WAT12_02055 [Candidatus Nitrotoga sp.]